MKFMILHLKGGDEVCLNVEQISLITKKVIDNECYTDICMHGNNFHFEFIAEETFEEVIELLGMALGDNS